MPAPANVISRTNRVGVREDLSDIIEDISPTDTKFYSTAGRGKCSNTYTEWQTNRLRAPNANNRHVEGDDSELSVRAATVRLGNRTQIVKEVIGVTRTVEAVNKAGRKKEMARELIKAMKELKRDIETIALSNQGAVAGSTSVPGQFASVQAYLKSNTNIGTGAAANPTYVDGAPAAGRTDGTQRAFLETHLQDVIAKAWQEGGEPDIIMTGRINKMRMSGFTGIAEFRTNTNGKRGRIVAGTNVYESDFGELSMVPNRFTRERDALVLDMDYIDFLFLSPFVQEDLAKTGDSTKKHIVAELTMRLTEERAHGIVADLTTT